LCIGSLVAALWPNMKVQEPATMSSDETYQTSYRQVPVGTESPNAVTVGIERDGEGQLKAAVWWESKGDVDADEAEYPTVEEALAAADAAKALHGFDEVVVALQSDDLWDAEWGVLAQSAGRAREPVGDIRDTDVSSDEAYELAAGIEAERDA
jgi:hypothetical protein